MVSISPDSDRQRRAKTFPDVCQQHYWSHFHVRACDPWGRAICRGRFNPAALCEGEKLDGNQMTNTDIKVFAVRGNNSVCECVRERE